MKKVLLIALTSLLLIIPCLAQSENPKDYKLYYRDAKWAAFYDASAVYEKDGHVFLWSLSIQGDVGILQLMELKCADATLRVHRTLGVNTVTDQKVVKSTVSKWLKPDSISKALKRATCGPYLLELDESDSLIS